MQLTDVKAKSTGLRERVKTMELLRRCTGWSYQ